MKPVSRQDAKAPRPFAALRLCVPIFLLACTPLRAADLARADALLVQAQALLTAARTELATTTNPTNDTNESTAAAGRVKLESFAWAAKKTADPAGLPAGARYGEGVENSKRCCQWAYPDFILHAWFPASTKAITGSTPACRWYHFTRTPKPHPGLSGYRWTNTHVDQGWYRWVGAK